MSLNDILDELDKNDEAKVEDKEPSPLKVIPKIPTKEKKKRSVSTPLDMPKSWQRKNDKEDSEASSQLVEIV